MYARLVRFELGSGKHDVALALAEDLAPKIAAQPGCNSVSIFGDEADGSYGVFVLWETQDHANAAAQVMRPILDQHLAGNIQAPPDTRLFEVLST